MLALSASTCPNFVQLRDIWSCLRHPPPTGRRYQLLGYFSTAVGSLAAGLATTTLMTRYDLAEVDAFRCERDVTPIGWKEAWMEGGSAGSSEDRLSVKDGPI